MKFAEDMQESTWEQKERLAMDIQDAEALYVAGDYQGVVDLVNGLFGWAKGELTVASNWELKDQADWCIKQLVQKGRNLQ